MSSESSAVGSTPRVLIVEDETLVSLFLADIVVDMGFEVVGPAAERGEALSLAASHSPALAIVDVSLQGGRDGIGVGQELAQRADIALVFMSGHDGVEAWPEVRALSPAAVLRKPCPPDEIEAVIAKALNGHGT